MPGDLALLLGAPELVADGRRALPPLADRVLLAQVARTHPGYFEPVAGTPGFAEALYRLVRELRGAGYSIANLAPLLDGLTMRRRRPARSRSCSPTSNPVAGSSMVPTTRSSSPTPDGLRGSPLLVYGVMDMPPALEALIAGISERMPAHVYLPEATGVDESPVVDLRERLLARGAKQEQAAEPEVEETSLERVRRSIFEQPSGAEIPADDSLRLVSAPDPAREVKAAARACLAWANQGVPFWEIAVAYRHGDAYRPLVEAVFAEASIPVYLHEGSPVAERPLGRQTPRSARAIRERSLAPVGNGLPHRRAPTQ